MANYSSMPRKKTVVKELSDGDLILLITAKRSELYQEVMARYQKKLYSYIYRLVGSREETEDILQNVFLKVYKNLKKFDCRKKFSSWIYRIAHNEAVNFLKRRNRKHFVSWEDIVTGGIKMEAQSEEKSPIDQWIQSESEEELKVALSRLEPKYQQILRLRYFSDFSYEEIARKIKKPVNTVGTLINRAKIKLAEIVQKD